MPHADDIRAGEEAAPFVWVGVGWVWVRRMSGVSTQVGFPTAGVPPRNIVKPPGTKKLGNFPALLLHAHPP